MKFLQKFYTGWCIFWFLIVFLLLYPFFLLFLSNKKTYPQAHFLNKLWAYAVFFITTVRWKIVWEYKPDKNSPVIYAPNHSSYLDIPSLCLATPFYFVFVGKSSLAKVPLFGYMFRKLYISVNRHNGISKYKVIDEACRHIDRGRSIAIFPEGTIPRENNPELISFKEGPFRIAIQKQIPVVPVTIPYNWIILPDNGRKVTIRRHLMKIIYHKPISTKGMTFEDIDRLREMTYEVINEELKKHNQQLNKTENINNFDPHFEKKI